MTTPPPEAAGPDAHGAAWWSTCRRSCCPRSTTASACSRTACCSCGSARVARPARRRSPPSTSAGSARRSPDGARSWPGVDAARQDVVRLLRRRGVPRAAARRSGATSSLVAGIESHICVAQTVLGALARRTTACTWRPTRSGRAPRRTAQVGLARMERAGAVVSQRGDGALRAARPQRRRRLQGPAPPSEGLTRGMPEFAGRRRHCRDMMRHEDVIPANEMDP